MMMRKTVNGKKAMVKANLKELNKQIAPSKRISLLLTKKPQNQVLEDSQIKIWMALKGQA